MSQIILTLKRGMQIAHLFQMDVINTVPEQMQTKPSTSQQSHSSFNFADSPVPPEWKERLCREMMKRIGKTCFPVVSSMLAVQRAHNIRGKEDKLIQRTLQNLSPKGFGGLRHLMSTSRIPAPSKSA